MPGLKLRDCERRDQGLNPRSVFRAHAFAGYVKVRRGTARVENPLEEIAESLRPASAVELPHPPHLGRNRPTTPRPRSVEGSQAPPIWVEAFKGLRSQPVGAHVCTFASTQFVEATPLRQFECALSKLTFTGTLGVRHAGLWRGSDDPIKWAQKKRRTRLRTCVSRKAPAITYFLAFAISLAVLA